MLRSMASECMIPQKQSGLLESWAWLVGGFVALVGALLFRGCMCNGKMGGFDGRQGRVVGWVRDFGDWSGVGVRMLRRRVRVRWGVWFGDDGRKGDWAVE
jgi:hypothetical protein